MDELQKAVDLGSEIQKIVKNQAFQQALSQMVERQVMEIKSSPPDETSKRESAFFVIKAMKALEDEFNVLANRADRAKLELEKKEKETTTKATRKR